MPVYFRYFILFSFLIAAAFAYYLGIYLENKATQAFIIKPSRERSEFVAARVTENLLCRYPSMFTGDALPNEAEAARFTKLVRVVMDFFPQRRIGLYNKDGVEIAHSGAGEVIMFNTDDNSSALSVMKGNAPFASAGMGNAYKDGDGSGERGYYAHVVLPLSVQNCPEANAKNAGVVGAAELYYSVDDIRDDIVRFRLFVNGCIVAIFSLFYVALYISSRRHEKIIQKQHEEKMHLEKAKAVAETKNHEKSMFLANITHELRTPLNAIIGFSEILKDEVVRQDVGGKYKEYINDIHASGVHLLGLINDILDYSKAEASKLEVEMIDVDIKKICMSCLRLMEPRAAEAELQLISNFPDKNVVMKGDPKRIKQIVLNLLSNSVKFTPKGGEVSLLIREEITEETISLTISDTGIGIPKKLISKALAPFGQVDSSMSRNHVGTGLGLPLAKKLTEIMGGKFIFQSEDNLGTSVTLRFPYSRIDVEKAAIDF
ncbi:MAG: HAMP domain-containing sensor histidine kinase [Rickettsiales bacterium]